jgi:N-methylhydantoinase A
MFGGAGPLFASFIIDELNISKAIIPREPANFSAYGMMMTDIIHDYKQTFVRLLMESNLAEIKSLFEEMEKNGLESLEREKVPEEARKVFRSVDVRYLGQAHALNIPIGDLSQDTKLKVSEDFHNLYQRIYGYRLDNPIQIVRLNVRVAGILQKPELTEMEERKTGFETPIKIKGKREIFLSQGPIECPIYERAELRKDDRIEGPAIVEEPSSTTFVGESQALTVDEWGNLIIERK